MIHFMLTSSLSLVLLLLFVYSPQTQADITSGQRCVNGTYYQTFGIPEGKPEVGPLAFTPRSIVDVDDTVFIECEVKANPKAQISWTFQYIREEVKRSFALHNCNQTLELRGASIWHAGLYKCVAKNKFGQTSSPESPLEVKVKDQSLYQNKAVVKKDKACVNFGDNVTLSCSLEHSEGICSWYKDNKTISVSPSGTSDKLCSLPIYNVTEADAGVYQCFMHYDLAKGRLLFTVNNTECNESDNNQKLGGRNNAGMVQSTLALLLQVYILQKMLV